jgi:hypothetical protein
MVSDADGKSFVLLENSIFWCTFLQQSSVIAHQQISVIPQQQISVTAQQQISVITHQ